MHESVIHNLFRVEPGRKVLGGFVPPEGGTHDPSISTCPKIPQESSLTVTVGLHGHGRAF